MKFDTLVIAGGKNDGQLKQYSDQEYESLIEIAGKPMVQHVIKAVKGVKEIDKIAIVGPEDLNQITGEDYNILKPEGSLVNNIKRGMELLNQDRHIIIITSDIPLVTPEIIKRFINRCQTEMNYDLFYPMISEESNIKKYPEVKRTYVHLKEGVYTGGNLVMVSPSIIQGPIDWYDKLLSLRKKPFKMSQMLGIKIIIKFIFRRLTTDDVEKKISEIIGHKCKALIFEYPEIGFDVDKPSDLKIMREKYLET